MSDTLLLVGKIAFLLLLYLFIFSVVRSSTRDLRLSAPVIAEQRWRMPGASADDAQGDLATVATATVEGGLWTLAVLKSPCVPEGAAYALPEGSQALAGRAPEADIFLDDTFVSAKHVLIEVTDNGLLVEDLKSTNGTKVNGRSIHEPVLVGVGDKIGIGDTVFQVKVR